MKNRPLLYTLIGVAIVAVSFGAILIRLAENVPVLSIAAWRLGVSFLLLIPFSWRKSPLKVMSRRDLLLSVASGVFLTLHFILWISSLRYTSVASSVVLVSTNPIFVALGVRFVFKESLSRTLVAASLAHSSRQPFSRSPEPLSSGGGTSGSVESPSPETCWRSAER
jgi:drug/metabolite transporter (DMT)-like permease